MRRRLTAWWRGAGAQPGNTRTSSTATEPAESESALLDALISAFAEPVVVLRADGRMLCFNGAARALAPALRVGEPASLALRAPEIVDAINQASATGEPQRFEFAARVPFEQQYAVEVVPVALRGTNAEADHLVVTFRNITPLRRLEEMRAEFVANASHELRTPLATLTGFVETLQGPAREDPAARERFLGIMKQQADRMARLIDDLLSLSRIELNAHRRPQTPVDLAPVLRQVVDALQQVAESRDVEISLTMPAESVVVPADRDELLRLFENLVENALKYGASGKRVEVGLLRETAGDGSGHAVVTVRDYGPGIAPEHLPRLTERFYRVDVVQSRAEGGTGLGLSLVKHIVNRHGGRLTIESTPGEGASFTVRLPAGSAGSG